MKRWMEQFPVSHLLQDYFWGLCWNVLFIIFLFLFCFLLFFSFFNSLFIQRSKSHTRGISCSVARPAKLHAINIFIRCTEGKKKVSVVSVFRETWQCKINASCLFDAPLPCPSQVAVVCEAKSCESSSVSVLLAWWDQILNKPRDRLTNRRHPNVLGEFNIAITELFAFEMFCTQL